MRFFSAAFNQSQQNCSIFHYLEVDSQNYGSQHCTHSYVEQKNNKSICYLYIISKMLKKLIHALICDHLAEYAPISDAQWGFQKGKSTTTALFIFTQDWFTLLDQRKEIYTRYPVFFDLQKAFNCV